MRISSLELNVSNTWVLTSYCDVCVCTSVLWFFCANEECKHCKAQILSEGETAFSDLSE